MHIEKCNELTFGDKILRGGVMELYFWEGSKKDGRIYGVVTYHPMGTEDTHQSFSIRYLDDLTFSSKTLEKAFNDPEASIKDIRLFLIGKDDKNLFIPEGV